MLVRGRGVQRLIHAFQNNIINNNDIFAEKSFFTSFKVLSGTVENPQNENVCTLINLMKMLDDP